MAHSILYATNFGFNLLKGELSVSEEESEQKYIHTAFRTGDFWQDGDGTLFPTFAGTKDGLESKISLEKRYVSKNIVKECATRASAAFLGRMPQLKYVMGDQQVDVNELRFQVSELERYEALSPEEKLLETAPEVPENGVKLLKAIEEASRILEMYWSRKGLGEESIEAVENRLVGRRGGLRVFVNSSKMAKDIGGKAVVYPKFPTLHEAASAIKVESVDIGRGRHYDDGSGKFSIVSYKVRKNWESKDTEEVVEFSYVADNGLTRVGIAKHGDGRESIDQSVSDALDLDGEVTYYEIEGEPYITKNFYSQNQMVNLALTCGGFSLVENGFGEMVTTNVKVETEMVDDGAGGVKEVPKNMTRGAGIVNNFIGLESVDEYARENIATPGVYFKDPSPLDAFLQGKRIGYEGCLEEVGQLFAIISGDATASGESRIQAMADFYLRIKRYKSQIDQMLSWAFTTVLRMLLAMSSGKEVDGLLLNVSVLADTKIKVGDLSNEEKTTVISMVAAGIISKETARVLMGISEPRLEEELIIREKRMAMEFAPDLSQDPNQDPKRDPKADPKADPKTDPKNDGKRTDGGGSGNPTT